MSHRRARVAFMLVVALSLVVLFVPASGVPSGIPVSDKVIHFLLFAALAATGWLSGLPPVPLVIGLVAYAGASEVLQSVLPIDRDGDLGDALTDTLGVLAGFASARGMSPVGARKNRRVGP